MTRFYIFSSISMFLVLTGCAPKPLPPVPVVNAAANVDYVADVQPILNKRCVVCHSCYNAPCQLKFSAYEGVARGATKAEVYNAERLEAADPTRLLIDANSAEAWHKQHGFFSVTDNHAAEGFNDAMLITLLDAKRKTPRSVGAYSPEQDELTCPKDRDEIAEYLDEHPERGMPYGFPELTESEFTTIAQWLQQGAKGPTPAQQAVLTSPSPAAAAQISEWEQFLNDPDPKHVMTARYLYEHLFLAHIDFKGTQKEFFELVRSRTSSPHAIDIIPTIRPYDDPGTAKFYYRFRKIHAAIVHKTHMVFPLSPDELARIKSRFIDVAWPEAPHITDYDPKRSANPFVSFVQIPAMARYHFLLDHSEYIIRTFIRGPVCKGQVALNVINDHFWVMFLDPKYDLSLKYPNLLAFNTNNLALPTETGSNFPAYRLLSDEYIKRAIDFYKRREGLYAMIYTDGLGYDAIWRGEEANDAPLLTVYRHFDSASVHKGALGDLPKTLWVIDYPLFERIYYALVAGFDVFGNVGHQTNVRRYMDRLRVEGESYFLDFMPKSERKKLFGAWNKNLSRLVEDKLYYKPSSMTTAVHYASGDPKREFTESVIRNHLLNNTGIGFDPINYFQADEKRPELPVRYESEADYIQAFRAVSVPGTAFIRTANGKQSNLAYVRVRMPEGREDVVFSIVINRWHDNVAFMFDEASRLNPAKDDADFIFDFVGSYPNILIDLKLEDAPAFFELIQHYKDTPEYRRRFFTFAVNRGDPRFWEAYDWFQQRFEQMHPFEAGLFDLNRYYRVAFQKEYDRESE